MKAEPLHILRRHVIEQHRREAVGSQDMEAALTLVRDDSMPRLSQDQWVDSCQLTAKPLGPEASEADVAAFWRVLRCYWVGRDEDACRTCGAPTKHEICTDCLKAAAARRRQGQPEAAPRMSSPVTMTLQEAAARAGVPYDRARRWMSRALDQVSENAATRKAREA